MSTTQQVTDVDIPEAGDQGGIGRAIGDYFTRVKGGEVGSLPALVMSSATECARCGRNAIPGLVSLIPCGPSSTK